MLYLYYTIYIDVCIVTIYVELVFFLNHIVLYYTVLCFIVLFCDILCCECKFDYTSSLFISHMV